MQLRFLVAPNPSGCQIPPYSNPSIISLSPERADLRRDYGEGIMGHLPARMKQVSQISGMKFQVKLRSTRCYSSKSLGASLGLSG